MSTSETTASDNEPKPADRRPSGLRSFIIISLLLHIPLFFYPVLRLCGWLELNVWVTAALLIPIACSQVISRWGLRNVRHPLARGLRHVSDFILGMSPLVLMTLLVFEILVGTSLIGSYQAALMVLLVSGLVAFVGLLAALVPGVKKITFEAESLRSSLRFVQITDVHIGSRSARFLEMLVTKIRRLEPDFVCITGDFIDATGIPASDLKSLSEFSCPVYFSIGNHERYEDLDEICERLESVGVILLRNRELHFRDDVQVLGIDDRDDALQVHRQLEQLNVDREAFNVLMYHRPLGLEAAADANIDLMISGHTHNGQIFPFNLIVNRVFDRIVGMYTMGKSRLYVSQGTGTWGPVMRVGTRGEITLFELNGTHS